MSGSAPVSHLSYDGRPASGSGDHASFTGMDRRLLAPGTTPSYLVWIRRLFGSASQHPLMFDGGLVTVEAAIIRILFSVCFRWIYDLQAVGDALAGVVRWRFGLTARDIRVVML
ncbi:hypothetical protein YC2023_096350 [Brassica napus]